MRLHVSFELKMSRLKIDYSECEGRQKVVTSRTLIIITFTLNGYGIFVYLSADFLMQQNVL